MRVLIVTAMYPTEQNPADGIFVHEQVASLRRRGIDLDVFHINNHGGVSGYLEAVRDFVHLWNRDEVPGYDIVHAHYGLAGLVARFQISTPVIVTFHGSDLLAFQAGPFRSTLIGSWLWILSNLAAVTASERIIVSDIMKGRLPFQSSVTIPMGVDTELFRPKSKEVARQNLGLAQEKHYILFVANPENRIKRFDVAKEAVRLLRRNNQSVELLPVFGLPHSRVPEYMNAADALVLTSEWEGSPCVIKEALACNMPIVSVDVGDVAKQIEDVKGCFLAKRDPADIARNLQKSLEMGNRLKTGRESILHLDLDEVAARVMNVYREVGS